jgi:hypothetical protein
VGSIDADGTRYGFAISASKTRMTRITKPIVSTQSRTRRHGCGRREVGLRGIGIRVSFAPFCLAILPPPHFTGLAKWARGAHFY